MKRGRGTSSIVGSPVLIGSVTTLIVVVAVFLAYNANAGLPFVPTYDVRAQLPSGANLVPGNDVRVGGFRVGFVNKITPKFLRVNGRMESVAVVDLQLDKVVQPLAKDTTVLVRPRSALGLKYVELTPGHSKDTFKAGSTIPLKNAGTPVEFDDLLNTFDAPTRQYEQDALVGYGDAFAGRGADLNAAITAFVPFFDHLTPVMKNLNNPDTELDQFFKQIGAVSAQIRPVSKLQADLFPLMADTFDAITNEPEALRQTIEKNPPTLDAGIESLPIQRSFLEQTRILSEKLEPTARILPTALPAFNSALRVGTPVLRETPALNRATGKTFDALDDLVKDPSVLLALQQLNTTTTVTAPLLQYIAPYQTVCSYGNYFFAGLGGHISEGTTNGAAERVLLKTDNMTQDNRWSDFPADRPVDIPRNIDPSNAYVNNVVSDSTAREAAHTQPFAPAIDAQGNADCQIGNTGYIDGPLIKNGRYPPADDSSDFDTAHAGGSHVVADADTPGLAGPTYLGVPPTLGRAVMAIFGRSKKKKKGNGVNPVIAGAIAFALTVLVVFVVFAKFNPFHNPYELHATFKSANNLATNSPVRIAGVEVGKVTDVEPIKGSNGAANVTMEIEKNGLPIHKDATLKIRPRIFLEGNLFVDLMPGTPQSPALKDGGTIPVNQTATPVQFGEVLTALQSDTRQDLQTFLREYATNGLGNGGHKGEKTGAQYYNEGLKAAPGAFRNAALANDATLGEEPGDLQRVIQSQQKVAAALSTHPESLKGLVTNLNITAAALSADESALQATVPALRDVVVKGRPALAAVDAALPSLRAFATDALPGVKSSPETLRESRPFIAQLRGLVSGPELKGLTADLRPTIPALAKLNNDTIPLLTEGRALSACQNNVILPFAKTPIPDPDFPANSGQPFYKQSSRAFVGLAGESRIFDANSPLFHVQFSTGPTTVVYQDRGQNFFAQAPSAPSGIRPIRPDKRPQFRPDVPCETQDPPNLNAPGGRPDRSVTPGPASLIPGVVCDIVGGLLIPCPGTPAAATFAKGKVQLNEILSFFKAKEKGKAAVDPLGTTRPNYLKQLSKLGEKTDPKGVVIPKAIADATKPVSTK